MKGVSIEVLLIVAISAPRGGGVREKAKAIAMLPEFKLTITYFFTIGRSISRHASAIIGNVEVIGIAKDAHVKRRHNKNILEDLV
jgi:hypothetical protein